MQASSLLRQGFLAPNIETPAVGRGLSDAPAVKRDAGLLDYGRKP